MKQELIARGRAAHRRRSSRVDRLLIGFARRAAAYKRADLILGDERALAKLFEHGVQIVYSGKAHPRDLAGKALVGKLVDAAKKHPGTSCSSRTTT